MTKYKLVCFDMDGVIFEDVKPWMAVHKKLGTLKEGKKLTKKYLRSDYDLLVREVVTKLWKGKDAKGYFEVMGSLPYIKGIGKVFEYLKKKKIMTAIISASSVHAAKRVQKDFGVDFIYANELIVKDGRITGKFTATTGVGGKKKAVVLRRLCKKLRINLSEVIYIGDSDNDIEAFKISGLPVAFNTASDELKSLARKTARNHAQLLRILEKEL